MDIKKATEVAVGGVASAEQLAAINAQTRAQLTAEQVYVFSLRLCDDQIDRDFERFDTNALGELAKLFIGKTGILDHQWSAGNQVARIFQTEVVQEDRVSYIKAWAYIRRGSRGEEFIADIEAGILKEVSVGCAMGMAVCSVCGSAYGECGHRKGEHYDGQLCCAILREPMDAYEFSFVAVPAQRDAGVLNGKGHGRSLKELAEEFGVQREFRQMYQEAELGRQYAKQLQDDVVRLCLSLELGVAEPVLRSVFGCTTGENLLAVKTALENRLAETMPLTTQLGLGRRAEEMESGFLI